MAQGIQRDAADAVGEVTAGIQLQADRPAKKCTVVRERQRAGVPPEPRVCDRFEARQAGGRRLVPLVVVLGGGLQTDRDIPVRLAEQVYETHHLGEAFVAPRGSGKEDVTESLRGVE